MKEIEKTGKAWDCMALAEQRKKRKLTNFSGLKSTHDFHNYLVTGDRKYHYLRYFKDKYFSDEKRIKAASLGCGDGNLE